MKDSIKLIMNIPESKIDRLCEKFLDAFIESGKTVEIFVNPSKRDIKSVQEAEGSSSKNVRFIADGNTKKIYTWNADLSLHGPMLYWLQNNGYVSRSVKLYNDPDVVSGEWNSQDQIELYYNVNWGPEEMGNIILDGDWGWVDKTGFKDFQRKLLTTVAKELGHRADPRILKAAGIK